MAKKTETGNPDGYDLKKLRAEFPAEDLKWRPIVGGITSAGKPWLQVSCYAGRESYENRLDEVFGPLNWYTDYERLSEKRMVCHLYIRIGNEWIKKYGPGEESTTIDQGKFMSGHTSAFKKACSHGLGIGRYIGEEEAYFVQCHMTDSRNYPNKFSQKKDGKVVQFWWKYPIRNKKNAVTLQSPEDSEPPVSATDPPVIPKTQPARMQSYGPEWVFNFGDFKGTALKDVPEHALLAYLNSDRVYPGLKDAIRFFLKSKGFTINKEIHK